LPTIHIGRVLMVAAEIAGRRSSCFWTLAQTCRSRSRTAAIRGVAQRNYPTGPRRRIVAPTFTGRESCEQSSFQLQSSPLLRLPLAERRLLRRLRRFRRRSLPESDRWFRPTTIIITTGIIIGTTGTIIIGTTGIITTATDGDRRAGI